MKIFIKIKTIILVAFCAMAFSLSAQNFTSIGDALKNGNSSELAKYFDSSIEVTIINTEAVYSKSQAEMVVKNFFSSNKPTAYKMVHNGDSGGAKYQIGELTTSSGTYRTYVYAKEKTGNMLIQEIRIEKK